MATNIENENIEYHVPVLFKETLDALITDTDGTYLDCTLGGGGHSLGILERLSSKGRLISIDQDDEAIAFAQKRLSDYGDKIQIFKNNFKNLDIVLYSAGVTKVNGILMDIGVSSSQVDSPERGFSYRYDGKLDMRMDSSANMTAADIVNTYDEAHLANIIYTYGEERYSRKIASLIVEYRKSKYIDSTLELAEIIKKAYKGNYEGSPAKRTFQALRIEVNKELEVLKIAIKKAISALLPGGRLAIITFHSLEDRIVKNIFRDYSTTKYDPMDFTIPTNGDKSKHSLTTKLVTRKPIVATDDELKSNWRAHSAKLRVIEKL